MLDCANLEQHNSGYEGVEAHLATLTSNIERNVMVDDIILPPNSKAIPLTQGKYAIVDEGDFEWLNQWKWLYHKAGNYAIRQEYSGKVNGSSRSKRFFGEFAFQNVIEEE